MKNNFFSIIIPLYNKENYIKQTLNSVLSQEYYNYEIIVIDDGSTDKGFSIVSEIAKKNKKIKIYQQTNQGVSIARNNGLKHAKYNYICFLDADDIWYPSFLTKVNHLIENYPKADIFAVNLYHNYGKKKKSYIDKTLPDYFTEGYIENYFKTFRNGKSILMPSNTCLRREILTDDPLFMPDIKLTEDTELWCRLALKSKIAFTKDFCVEYRIEKRIPKIERTHYIVESLENQLASGSIPEKYIDDILVIIQYQLLVSALFFILNNRKMQAKEILFGRNLISFKRKRYLLIGLLYLPSFISRFLYYIWQKHQ